MKQTDNDVVLKVSTEYEQYQINLNWDVNGFDLVRHFANIMRGMTFATPTIIQSLREVADDMEEDMRLNNDNNESLRYGTTNQERSDY